MRRILTKDTSYLLVGLFAAFSGQALAQPETPPAHSPSTTASRQATAEFDKAISQASRLMPQFRYREAAALLTDAIRQGNSAALSPARRRQFHALLGRIYLESKLYPEAVSWLGRSWQQLEAVGDPDASMLKEQRLLSLQLAQAYTRLGQTQQAATVLRRMVERYESRASQALASRMELLLLLAEAQAGSSGAEPASRPAAELKQLAGLLLEQSVDRSPGSTRRRALEALAEYQLRHDQFEDAVSTLRVLLDLIPDGDHRSQIHTWQRIATVHRAASQGTAEITALKSAERIIQQRRNVKDSPATEISITHDAAITHQLLAGALARERDRGAAVESLQQSRRHFLRVRQLLEQLPPSQKTGYVAHTPALARLAIIERRLLEEFSQPSPSVEEVFETHRQLLRRYKRDLLPDDPRLHRLRLTLAVLYTNYGSADHFAATRRLLHSARDHWLARKPVDYEALARTLNLLGELALIQGRLGDASSRLEQAASICEERLPDHVIRWQVNLNLGRVAAAGGDYDVARGHFEQILKLTPASVAQGPIGSAAWLNLGLLDKALFKLKDAKRNCEKAVELRRLHETDKQRDMLQCYLALSELAITERNSDALLKWVEAARPLAAALPPEHRFIPALRHHQAMIHYLRDEDSPDATQREAARQIWRTLLTGPPKADHAEFGPQDIRQARTLHYLARLDYRDALAKQRAWRKQRAPLEQARREAAEQYRTDLSKYDDTASAYASRRKQFDRDAKHFRMDVENYRVANSKQYGERKKEYEELQARRKMLAERQNELQEHKGLLDQQLNALSKLREKSRQGASDDLVHDRSLDQHLASAERFAGRAVEVLEGSEIYPSLEYAARCNLAEILTLQARRVGDGAQPRDRARRQLAKAVELMESPRAATFGGNMVRAEFFARYQTAFDLLVKLSVESGDMRAALIAAEQSRRRNLLDQIQSADVERANPSLAADDHIQATHQRLSQLEARLHAVSEEVARGIKRDQLAKLRSELRTTRQQYRQLYDEFLDKNLSIASRLSAEEIGAVVDKWSRSRHVTLYYYTGGRSSFLFVLGGPQGSLPPQRLRKPWHMTTISGSDDVSSRDVAAFVETYHSQLRNPDFDGRNQDERLFVITEILLPRQVRTLLVTLKKQQASHVMIVPHGLLAHLPFEALDFGASTEVTPRYAVDQLPPLAYAPSLMILDRLDGRPQQPRRESGTPVIVTLGNPDYGEERFAAKLAPDHPPELVMRRPSPAVRLDPLVHSAEESRRIADAFVEEFGTGVVQRLTESNATEGRLRAIIQENKCAYVHLAAHAWLDSKGGRSFPRLALTLPSADAEQQGSDDGNLELREIYDLKLSNCELAALSACNTNLGVGLGAARQVHRELAVDAPTTVGGQRRVAPSLDASFSLASAFLASGSRRVLATQWRVADESTAEFMATFFTELATRLARDQQVNYARLVQETRADLRRRHPQWDTPFHWAPFVLIGPADMAGAENE